MAEPCSTARRKERSAPSMTAAMDNEEATGGLDRRGSKLEVVEHMNMNSIKPLTSKFEGSPP